MMMSSEFLTASLFYFEQALYLSHNQKGSQSIIVRPHSIRGHGALVCSDLKAGEPDSNVCVYGWGT